MPTKIVTSQVMSPGGKDGGKHWTEKEVEARRAAEAGVKRKGRVTIHRPDWLSDEAVKVWKRTMRQVAGLDLLDNLDGEMLAIYCDAVVKYREASKKMGEATPTDDDIKAVQAWARLVAGYADKLGFTPASRARLVKKKADEIIDRFGSEFDD
jgi:P27 family predicted phage terminase small subunit